jgi:hypothetical protein
VTTSTPEGGWAPWALGNLADTLDRTSDLLGALHEVVEVWVAPPPDGDHLPRVRIVARSEVEAARRRRIVEAGEFPASFASGSSLRAWSANVAALRLDVEAAQPGSSKREDSGTYL